MTDLKPRQAKAIIETGLKHPFWVRFLRPYLESEIESCQRLYRTVPKEDLLALQLNHAHLEDLLNYPKEQLEQAIAMLELEKQPDAHSDYRDK